MRSSQKKLTAAAAGASLIAVIGVAMAQATQIGPDADQSNNEVKTGIQDNSNNSYKTWPQALYSDQQQSHAAAPAPTQVSQAPADNTAPAATDNSASSQSSTTQSTTTDNSSSTTDNSAAMPAPKADRN